MKAQDWYLKGFREGHISSGNAATITNDMLMPIVVNRFIVSRRFNLEFVPSASIPGNIWSVIRNETGVGARSSVKYDGMQIVALIGHVIPRACALTDPSLK